MKEQYFDPAVFDPDVRGQVQELALSSLGSPEQQHCTPLCQGREAFREPREEPSQRLQRVGRGPEWGPECREHGEAHGG